MLRFLSIRHLAVIDAARGRVRARPQRPDRRDRRRQVDPRRSRRPAPRRPRLGRPRPHRRGARPPSKAIFERADGRELIVRREITAQGRSRAFVDGALATAGGAARSWRRRLVELHGQHEHQTLLDPADAPAPARRVRRRSSERRGAVGDALRRAGATLPTALDATAARRAREGGARSSSLSFQLGEIEQRRAARRARTRSSPPSAQVLANAERARAALRRRPTPRCTRATTRCSPRSAASGSGWRSWPRSTRGSSRTSTRATAIKSQLEDLAFFLRRLRRRHRRVAGAAAAGRGSAGAARAAEAEVRARRSPTSSRRRDALRAELDGARARRRARRRRSSRRAAEAARGVSATRRARCRRRAARRRRRFARRSKRLLAELAMERTRFEVRFDDRAPPETRGRAAASTRRSSSCRRIRARTCGRWRASSRAASCRASCSRSRR